MFSVQSKSRLNILPLLLLRVAFTAALALVFTEVVGTHAEAAQAEKARTRSTSSTTLLPDLTISSVNAPSTAQPGQSIVLSASIKNQGKVSVSTVQVAFYLTKSASSTTGATLLDTQNVGSLPAGASVTLTTTPLIPSATSPGTFYVAAVADPSNAIKESNETNNTRASGAIAVTMPVSTQATVWVTDTLTRVQPTDAPGTVTAAAIKAARNEYEAFQVIVTAPSSADLVGVNINVSDLVGPSTIAKSNIARYRAHYIPVTVPSENTNNGVKSPNPPGDWPDALVPSTVPGGTYQSFPFTVLAGKNQPVWVEVYVPKGTPAGTYNGTITVTVSGQSSATIPLSLSVWGFTLPDKPTLATEFWSYDLGLSRNYMYSNGADRATLQTNISADLRNHRLGFGDARQPDATTTATLQRQARINAYIDGLTDAQVITLRDAYPGQLDHQGADEPKTQAAVDAINDPNGAIQHSRSLGMPELLTIADPVAWSANVDIYVAAHYMLDPNLFYWSKTNIQGILSAGKRMWSYTAGLQTNNTPNWLLDFDLIHFRGVPWLDYTTGLTGLLYWTPVNWCPGDVWTNAGTGANTCANGSPIDSNQNMEGVFYYPGDKVGAPNAAIPSARLKALRDGVEDYDYLTLLAQLGDPGLAGQLAATLAPAWNNWSHDPAVLASARAQAATRIVQLGGQ